MPRQFAQVADILRSSQRDESFVLELQNTFSSILQQFGNRTFHSYRRYLPAIAESWYYFLTSLTNRQTLGEEYAGILRVISSTQLPGTLLQILWLALFICGDNVYDRCVNKLEECVEKLEEVPSDRKEALLKIADLLRKNKSIFKAIHRSLFFVNGRYYNFANRFTGMKYVRSKPYCYIQNNYFFYLKLLLRDWMQDVTYTQSFRLLGQISLIYLLFELTSNIISTKREKKAIYTETQVTSSKICTLCSEFRKNTCVTPCGHLFCWECIHNCLLYQSNCPICREFVKPSRIVSLQNYI